MEADSAYSAGCALTSPRCFAMIPMLSELIPTMPIPELEDPTIAFPVPECVPNIPIPFEPPVCILPRIAEEDFPTAVAVRLPKTPDIESAPD